MSHSASATASMSTNPAGIQSRYFFPAFDIRFARRVEALHVLGPRATYELLTEFRRHWPQHAGYIEHRFATYAALDLRVARRDLESVKACKRKFGFRGVHDC